MDIGIHHKAPPSPKCVRPRYEPTFQWPSQQRLRHGVVLNENLKDEIQLKLLTPESGWDSDPGYSRGWRPWGRGDQNCENWDGQSAQICLVCQGQKGLNKNYPCSKKGPIYSHLDHLVDSNFWFKDEHGTNNNNDPMNPNRPDKKNILGNPWSPNFGWNDPAQWNPNDDIKPIGISHQIYMVIRRIEPTW